MLISIVAAITINVGLVDLLMSMRILSISHQIDKSFKGVKSTIVSMFSVWIIRKKYYNVIIGGKRPPPFIIRALHTGRSLVRPTELKPFAAVETGKFQITRDKPQAPLFPAYTILFFTQVNKSTNFLCCFHLYLV